MSPSPAVGGAFEESGEQRLRRERWAGWDRAEGVIRSGDHSSSVGFHGRYSHLAIDTAVTRIILW